MTMLRRICLVGVRGVGKTTLLRSVIADLPDVDYIVGSAVLRELAGPDFARFDHLPMAVKEGYRHEAISWMERRQATTGKHILCDGHTALLDESTGIVGCVFTERDCRFFRELILVEAPAEVVLARRQGDLSKRRSLNIEVIEKELSAERESSRLVAERWGMILHRLPPDTDPDGSPWLKELLSR
jgi:adenylate kinase